MSDETRDLTDEDLMPGNRVRKLPPLKQKLGGAVPVRFQPETVERIKRQADREGMTVSSWIRREVDRALHDREVTVITFTAPGDPAGEFSRLQHVGHG